jgi:hypothetical protein
MSELIIKRTIWIDNEPGPKCFCGGKTTIRQIEDGHWVVWCSPHNHQGKMRTAITPLPSIRPENWDELTWDDIRNLSSECDNEFENTEWFKGQRKNVREIIR